MMADTTITADAATRSTFAELSEPRKVLGLTDAIALIVGIVVGAGIFRTPSVVAANAGSSESFMLAWAAGGFISLLGVLCYAELASAYPSTGGDYHFLKRAFGRRLAFIYAWGRMSVIQTGSVALLAFIFGDYASQIINLGTYSSVIFAASAVVLLTLINIGGVTFGTGAQKLLTTAEVAGIALIVIAAFFFTPGAPLPAERAADTGSFGLMMVFVLLTFGGWNEAAYISGEFRSGKDGRRIARAFIIGIAIVTAIYLLVNLAYLYALGLGGTASSDAVAGDLMRLSFGDTGVWLIGLIVAVSALTSANATIFTGARTNYAVGRDFAPFRLLAKWNVEASAPVNAFIVQGLIALALVLMGSLTRKGFETIVEYTAPVFWFFFLLVGIALFVLRHNDPEAVRPFRVPLYPFVPAAFCLTCGYLLYSSTVYTGVGALVGVAVLAVGTLFIFLAPSAFSDQSTKEKTE